MPNEKRVITITITDVDNIQSVLVALDNLFRAIMTHYLDKDDMTSLNIFILSISAYFGNILNLMGYQGEDFNQNE